MPLNKAPSTWIETGFTWERTADGSPTLRVRDGGESMHHSGGAFSETNLIYGEVVREVFALDMAEPALLSVGLGLGYVEFFVAAASIKNQKTYQLISLEPVTSLVDVMILWIQKKLPTGEIQNGLDEVASFVANFEGVSIEDIRRNLLQSWQSGLWTLGGALSHTKLPQGRFHGILYDVFAAKTYPDLWTQVHLENFLNNCAAIPTATPAAKSFCLFSTFACTGALKRALKANQFEVIKRPGFKGTRNSTLARR